MNFIIQDMLDFAQIKEGKFRQNFQIFNIREAVDKVMCILKQKAVSKGIIFSVNYTNIGKNNEELGQESPMIFCDEHRIMQVLLGLQSNALKFTQNGKVETIVQIISDGSQDRYLKI